MDKNFGIAISSRVRLARNVADVPFPARLDDERAFSVVMKAAEKTAKDLFKFKFYQMGHLPEIDRAALVERHLISNDLMANLKTGAVIISDDETVSVMINEEDHYRIQCVLPGDSLGEAYKKANLYDDVLATNVRVAYDENLGYLTACPTNLGTAMRASVMLFLPALTINRGISAIINAVAKVGLTVRGVYGEGSKAEGYLYQVSNQVSLGVSEQDVLRMVQNAVDTICRQEQLARDDLKARQGINLVDSVSRAYGVLTNACKMSSSELVELMSEYKLGVYSGLLECKSPDALEKLQVLCQPANLSKIAGKQLSASDRDIFRAEYVKKQLKSISKK